MAVINSKLNTQRGIDQKLNKTPVPDLDLTQIKTPNDNGMLVTSTNVKINGIDPSGKKVMIGMIQSFSVSETRNVTKLQSIGIEGVTQAVPENYKGGTINAQRVALYGKRLYDVFRMEEYTGEEKKFGRNKYIDEDGDVFKTLKQQRFPFEIVYETRRDGNKDGDGAVYTETYIDCWISSYKKNYQTSNITISEQVTIAYAEVI